MLAMLMLVLQYSMAGEATLTLNGSAESNPKDFFTHDPSGKFNFNNKFTGATYDGIDFTSGLKFEGTTKVMFTTDKVSTVTIVQSTQSNNTIKLDGTELAVADAVAGTGCRIYTISNVAAGDHTITRGSGESGLFYVKVEWVDAYTATFENTGNWAAVYAYTFTKDDSGNVIAEELGEWPGTQLVAGDDDKYLVTVLESMPQYIIFNNNAGDQTDDLKFVNGAEYNRDGRIVNKTAYTATFTTEAEWEHVYAYCWNNTQGEEALGVWPGTEITADAQGVYAISLEAEYLPEGILFNDGNGTQTPDYVFADGAAFEYNKNTYTATFTTDAEWTDVYAYVWTGSGNSATNKILGEWPGTKLKANEGVYTVTISTFGDAPEKIQFNNGTDKTRDMDFTVGRAYKWITATPLYVLAAGDSFSAGSTVSVKDADDDVVATITYGVEGGATFNAATGSDASAENYEPNEDYAAFISMTAGNGQNGGSNTGTVYAIKPIYDGTITVGVKLNANKNFFIQEDGTNMEGYNGITSDYVAHTSFSFPVKAGSTYAIYCTGSKLGFYGFDYKFTKPVDYYLVKGVDDTWTVEGKMAEAEEGVFTSTLTDWAGNFFAIAPNKALDANCETIADWTKVIRPKSNDDFWVEYFINYEDETQSLEDGGKVWHVADNNSNKLTLTYTPADNKFTITTDAVMNVTISDAGYATYSNTGAYKVSGENVKTYVVTGTTTKLQMQKLDDGFVIPGGTGVVLEGTGNVTITPRALTEDIGTIETNYLIGSGNYTYDITGEYPGGGYYNPYILANKDKGVGFYKFDPLEGIDIPAHKAFLAVPDTNAAPFFGFADAETTGIHSLTPALSEGEGVYYTLDGRRVEKPTKGLYIVNGKKVLVP